jgi:SAM-dependent methyltransferase
MNTTPWRFWIGFALVGLAWTTLFIVRRADKKTLFSADYGTWNLSQLLLASSLTLFTELALIRWIAVEVRIFAYCKNLAVLLCFLGFGLGCALSRQGIRWIISIEAIIGMLIVVKGPLFHSYKIEGLTQALGASSDAQVFGVAGAAWSWSNFITAMLILGVLLLLIVVIFIPLGQFVSRQLDASPVPLKAYSWNLLGSLMGILLFFFACRFMLSPVVWLTATVVGFVYLQSGTTQKIALMLFIPGVILLLHETATSDHLSFWTPYQEVEMTRHRFPDGELSYSEIDVNHTGFQWITNHSPEFLARHPQVIKGPSDEDPLNLPYRFAAPNPSVLIVGSGTGNDPAAAVRNHSRSIDAVEIDPAILALGRREHPEHPYDSPTVSAYLTDARAFLKRTQRTYDLIVFGLLDSHTQFSDYTNMRIDNFVYTKESFFEAKHHLGPDGVLFVKFDVLRPWVGKRLYEMISEVFGKPPVTFTAAGGFPIGGQISCFAVSNSARVQSVIQSDPRLSELVSHAPAFLRASSVPVTTDDWPYLYHQGRWIPRPFYAIGILVLVITAGLYAQVPAVRTRPPSMFFFCMGAGFFLLEAQAISRLALYFGTVWQVNAVVIAALLTTLLASNYAIESGWLAFGSRTLVGGVLGGLALAYVVPWQQLPTSASATGWIAVAVFAMPVFFAGSLFATEFRREASPSAALASNMLGAVAGGLLENLSFVLGMRALLLVALAVYVMAGVFLLSRESSTGHNRAFSAVDAGV